MMNIKSIKVNLRGTSHIKDDLPCQDRCFCRAEGGVYVYALCDGAGSKPHSELGAQCTAEVVCGVLCQNPLADKAEILSAATKALSEIGENIKEYASTLMFVSICGEDFVAGHIGDGVIGVAYSDKFETLSKPQNGMYKNETVFTTDDNALENFRIYKGKVREGCAFVMMTDGLSDSLYSNATDEISHSLFDIANMIFTNGEEEAEDVLLETITKFIVPRTNDDISGVILVCDNN